ncbi:rhodanese-like domain-containing protein [Desulfuromonas versatilis]|uniref:Rhodanese-like domain-containing protein n=1 Tax=Desulfuromonas versatilis TaxID=2802975 RepID=A0ABN6DS50_9BACT|nr:rhodanese-like domain-containing protein [Desulfuromonas versatilis]BCR03047.1 rhodanese-like domain-containing protein [Desulfuromonas versatilis]
MIGRFALQKAMFLLALLAAGCSAAVQPQPPADPAGQATAQAPGKIEKAVEQDPALRITTAEVMHLVALGPELGHFFLVDARPEVKYQEGHVPHAVSIPKPLLSQNLDKLPKDETIIFYCGGLHCALSPESAEIARQNGFSNLKVWYEGMPGWTEAGNYAVTELPYVEKLVTQGSDKPFLLVDSRPAVKYNKAFIPGAVSIPKAEFDLKKGLLPTDKDLPVIFYCGGYKCELSHESAKLALELGYKNVSVFAAGEPAWQEAGLPLWGDEPSGAVTKAAPKEEGALPEAIAAAEFKQLLQKGKIQVIDVRAPKEFGEGHIPGSINIYDEDFIFKTREAVAQLATDKRVVLVCSTGARSASAYYAILGESDYPNKKRLQYLDCVVDYLPDGSFVAD